MKRLKKFDSVVNPKNGFIRVVDGGIVVEATVAISKVAVKQKASCDFSIPPSNSSEVTLVFGQQRLDVSKHYLAIVSPVFKAMFFGDFNEKDKEEIAIEEVDHNDFLELLQVIYPSHKSITVDNVESLLRLADLYGIQCVVRDCERLLCGGGSDCSKISLGKKLLWADRYRLAGLQFASLNSMKTLAEAKMIKSTAEYGHFSLQMKEALLERILMLNY